MLAESLHAAIIADAFRVPWIPVRIGHKFLAGKWTDWAAGIGVTLQDAAPMFPLLERTFSLPQTALADRRARRRRARVERATPDTVPTAGQGKPDRATRALLACAPGWKPRTCPAPCAITSDASRC